MSLLIIAAYLVGVSKVLKAVTAQGGIWNVGHQAFTIMGGIFSALLLVFCGLQIPIIVNGFMIPEAGALKEAIDLTQQLLGSFK